MDSQKSVREEFRTTKVRLILLYISYSKRWCLRYYPSKLKPVAEKLPPKERHLSPSPWMNAAISVQETLKPAGAAATRAATWESIKARLGNVVKTMIDFFNTVLSKKARSKKRPKRKDWSKDRDFTPLDEPLDKVLEYMLSSGLLRLPKAASPSTVMGKYIDQFCGYHRATGHDTEHCFDLQEYSSRLPW